MVKIIPATKREDEADNSGIIVIPEYQFNHGIFKLNPNEMNADGLQYSYSKLFNFLKLKDKPDEGVTIIVSP